MAFSYSIQAIEIQIFCLNTLIHMTQILNELNF